MIVIPGRVPIAIHPLFWLFSGLIGWIYTQNLIGVFVWIGVILLSVLVHEMGHALTAMLFRQRAAIQLVALGGLTSYEGPKLRFWQQFLITFNGPLFGFFLFLIATFLLQGGFFTSKVALSILQIIRGANLFWTLVNLLPILPLDGGQLLRIVLEASFGVKGFKASLLIGGILAVLFAFYCFMMQAFLPGALFFLFAFESLDAWRKSRLVNASDRDQEMRLLMAKGEAAFQEKQFSEAKAHFEEVYQKGKGGLFAAAALQYLAFLDEEEGKHKEAYERLLGVAENLSEDAIPLMHRLAFLQKNYALVAKLSSDCYQVRSTQEIALRNARAFAYLKEVEAAGGWLQTAAQFGGLNLALLLQEPEFVEIKEAPDFAKFFT